MELKPCKSKVFAEKKIPKSGELEVLKQKNVDAVELHKYFFPNDPMLSDYEEILANELDYKCPIDSPELEERSDHCFNVAYSLEQNIRTQVAAINSKYKRYCCVKRGLKADFNLIFRKNDYCMVSRSGRGVRVTDVKGKYLFICCFLLPLCSNDSSVWKAVTACCDMYSKLKGNFEMVIVAKMRPGWTRDQDAFNAFINAFPPYCLTIPFHLKRRRSYLWKSFASAKKDESSSVVLLDPNRIVLLHTPLCWLKGPEFIPVYGLNSTPFPFVSRNGLRATFPKPFSLQEHLCSDFVYRKTLLPTGKYCIQKASLSELNSNKHVALYLYSTGNFLPHLAKVSHDCTQSGKQLEIVVVNVPEDLCNHDPHLFPKVFSKLLAQRKHSWWVAPYNNSASAMLHRMYDEGERVFVFAPNSQFCERRAGEIMVLYGINAFPFTFNTAVAKVVEEIKQVTLDYFLRFLQLPVLDYCSTGKHVLFYFDKPTSVDCKIYAAAKKFSACKDVIIERVSLVSDEIQKMHMQIDENSRRRYIDATRDFSHRKWHTVKNCTYHAHDFLSKFFFKPFSTIVAFGKDGKISSVLAHRLPISKEAEAHIKSNLFDEVSRKLSEFFDWCDEKRFMHLDAELINQYVEDRKGIFC